MKKIIVATILVLFCSGIAFADWKNEIICYVPNDNMKILGYDILITKFGEKKKVLVDIGANLLLKNLKRTGFLKIMPDLRLLLNDNSKEKFSYSVINNKGKTIVNICYIKNGLWEYSPVFSTKGKDYHSSVYEISDIKLFQIAKLHRDLLIKHCYPQ
jgi:hypothetical protein